MMNLKNNFIKLLIAVASVGIFFCGRCEKDMKTQPILESSTDLLNAAKSGNVDEVKRLISAGTDLEIRDADRRTPLMLATLGNHVEVAKMLIENGANVNAQDD